jgi:6,7-dimethyl-8-ribityllumazine synthase
MSSLPPSKVLPALKVAVLTTAWYPEVVAGLEEAALATLAARGIAEQDLLRVKVPGAFELPQAAMWVARAGLVDAVVALGCVIRGETPHFDLVAGAAAEGLLRAALDTGIPVALGVITADTMEQARARSGSAQGKGGNKGAEAAAAAVDLARTFQGLEGRRR